jgi:hypothetical protein
MGMINSKSTDKLIIIEQMIDQLPVDKIKSINIVWKELVGTLETTVVPDVIIEMFED